MDEKLELETLKVQVEQMNHQNDINRKEYRFRCLEFARSSHSDISKILEDAKKFFEFVYEK